MLRISTYLILVIIAMLSFRWASAAPGDILFEDDFESGLSQWSVSVSTGDASIGTETANSGSNSVRLRWDTVTLTSSAFNAAVPLAEIQVWIRRGDDSFSENPDSGEDLVFEYLDQSGSWTLIDTFYGSGTPGEIYNPTYAIPVSGLYSNLQLRFRFLQGSGFDWDYWHIDDVIVTEAAMPTNAHAEWRLDETSWNGTSGEVLDNIGSNHGIAFSTTPVSGLICNAADFSADGINDYISLNNGGMNGLGDFSISAWVSTTHTGSQTLLSAAQSDIQHNEATMYFNSDSIFWPTLREATFNINTQLPLTSGFTDGNWHHLVWTRDQSESTTCLYIDKTLQGCRTHDNGNNLLDIASGGLILGQDQDIVGGDFDAAQDWQGLTDELIVFDSILSISAISQIYDNQIAGNNWDGTSRVCPVDNNCSDDSTDAFNNSSYSNNDGSAEWSTSWTESDDDGSPTSGKIQISGGALRLTNSSGFNGDPAIEREVDILGALTATLSVDLSTSGTLENGDRFDISISTDGGLSWTSLQFFSNDINNTYTYDVTAYASTNFRVRFRINQGYRQSNEYIEIDNVSIAITRLCGPDHFRLIHDNAGINCLREAITIRAEDATGNLVTDYTGTINLSLITNHGNWFTVDENNTSSDLALGTLTDVASDNDGAATYQFDVNDGGSIVLYLQNTVAETTNINILDGAVTDDETEGDITFRPFGFLVTPTPPGTQVAGRPFTLSLTAAGQTPGDAECGVIEEYTGSKTVSFWSSYTDPLTSPTNAQINGNPIATNESASLAQAITFNNGVATIQMQYDDVGEIALSAKDDVDLGEPPTGNLDEIIGSLPPFIVRPFGYHLAVDGEPIAIDASSPNYRVAGDLFSMTVFSTLWQSGDDTDLDGVPDSGADLSDNGVTPNISAINGQLNLTPLALQVTESNGTLLDQTILFTEFGAVGSAQQGSATINQYWDEVGRLQINAVTSDFMGGGQSVLGQRPDIGLFYPARFIFSPVPINVPLQCDTFTYMGFDDGINAALTRSGQSFDFDGSVSAVNLFDNVTLNYHGDFAKLNDLSLSAYNVSSGAPATGQFTSVTGPNLSFSQGVSSFTYTGTNYQHNTLSAPFDLRIDVSADDGSAIGNTITSEFEVRHGRVRILDAYGPELSPLEMRILSEYFNGTNWQQNNADSCTTYVSSQFGFQSGSYTENLSAGETSIIAPGSNQLINSGISIIGNGVWFSAPGENNYGSVNVEMNLTSLPWLQFNWDSSNSLSLPSARLSFGYFRGSDRVIYWREVIN
ncbi:DUF6701 domain-containing protein [Aliikangiella sp. G2MR2-5]|uniref:DUF6701 domain-containing protein n=1 Tax=Aliikangiella sp. G2MR2-5 TaxID=2788943 RepID=UPI0018ABA391|nr:DUF6701 domain-containing protein [Aliikangiella sp. G2MR2-5]